MSLDASNVKIEAGDYIWGNPEQTKVCCVADVSGNLGGDYITLEATDETSFHAWFDVDNGDTDPAPSGSTAIEVDISSDDTAAAVATALATALDANANFDAKVDDCDNTCVLISNVGFQAASASIAAVANGASSPGFTITQLAASSRFDLGLIEGSVDLSTGEDLSEVFGQQFGTQKLDDIRSGLNIEAVTIELKESTVAKIKEILSAGGSTYTPSGGTEVVGWGSKKRFLPVGTDARYLNIHPRRLASSDRSADWTFWKAYPNLSGINFSGEDQQLISVEFNFYPQIRYAEEVETFVFGDWQQNFWK